MNIQNILTLLFVLTIWQCQPTASAEVSDGQNQIGSTTNQTKEKLATIVKDSLPSRSTQMMSRSRKKEEISTKYPFDIPLEDVNKKVVASNELIPNNGKPTLVLFWLTTCYPCRLEMKAIKEKYAGWQKEKDFNVVAISTDWDKNFGAFVKQVNENQWPWKSYRDLNREFRLVLPGGLNGLPQSFIFDKNGEIAYHSRKYSSGDEDKIFEKIKSLN